MKVCLSGTRSAHPSERCRVEELVAGLEASDEVVTGGSGNVDWWAARAARARRMACTTFEPGWVAGKRAGPERNARMAAYADRLVAFWDGLSRGTSDTIRHFEYAGKPIQLVKIGQHPAHAPR